MFILRKSLPSHLPASFLHIQGDSSREVFPLYLLVNSESVKAGGVFVNYLHCSEHEIRQQSSLLLRS